MFRWVLLVAVVLAAAVGIVVGVMNPDPVSVQLPGARLEFPLGALLMVVLSIGLVAGCLLFFLLFHLPSRLRSGRRPSTALTDSEPHSNA
jgi:uncharacterized membrane protein YciS (DUF1049 family)